MTPLRPPQTAGEPAAVTVGIDLGGTGTRIIALDPGGAVLRKHTLPTASSARDAVAALASGITAVTEALPLGAIGIGASGPVGSDGVIRNDDTLPAYSHIPLTDLLADRFRVPCSIANDAVAAAIGENTCGAGQRSESLLMVTLGTGIGVAMLTPAGPFRAADGSHPEGGHIPVTGPPAPCYCGLQTCWEQLASRGALDRLMTDGTTDPFTTYGQRVGIGVAALLTFFRPARVVLGGSAAQYLPLFARGYEEAQARSGEFSWTPPCAPAALGELSGAIGAAVLARGTGTYAG